MLYSFTFITGNAAKAAQLRTHLSHPVVHQKLDIPEIQSLNLEEVAVAKAKEAYRLMQSPVLVEDTALTFLALGSLPGPLVKWFLTTLGNDGLAKLLNSYDDRRAVAEVCFALCDEDGVRTFSAKTEGFIVNEPRGAEGFGWDPVFIPDGYTQTWGEMDAATQAETSMRRRALIEVEAYLKGKEHTPE